MDQPVTVRMPGAVLEFSNIMHKAGAMDTICTVWRDCPADPLLASTWDADRTFRYHLSARSLSNVTAFRRELDKFHGDDLDWTRILHDAIRQAEKELLSRISSIDPWPEPNAPARTDLIDGVLVAREVNCIFGMGGCGKSLAAESMALAISGSGAWAGRYPDRQISTLWLDYENPTHDTFGTWRQALMHGGISTTPGSLRWMPGAGVPLQDLLDRVASEMKIFHCEHLVIDSIAFACGGDPLKAEVATAFYGAIAKLGAITTTLIAHTDKAENDKYPFGSIFWHNGIHGMSWMVKHAPGPDEVSLGFYNRKATKGPRPKDFAVKFGFETAFASSQPHEEGVDVGGYPVITLSTGDIKAVSRATGEQSLSSTIMEILAVSGKLSAPEIGEATGKSAMLVRARLAEMAKNGKAARDASGNWYLPYGDEERI